MTEEQRYEELPNKVGNFLVNHIFKVPSICQPFLPLYETFMEITL